jgi:hypothetical protein
MKKLIKFAMIIGAIAAAARLVGSKKAEWEGLTEAQVRGKLDERLPDRVPEEKRAMVADKVVAKMRSRGKLIEGSDSAAGETAEDGSED